MDIRRSNDREGSSNRGAQSQAGMSSGQRSRGGSGQQVNNQGSLGPILLILGLLVVLGIGAYVFFGSGLTSEPAAVVNGQNVSSQEFQDRLERVEGNQQTSSLTATQQRELVLQGLINEVLLAQAAREQGLDVTNQEVDNELQSQIEQIGGEEEFATRLEDNNLTRAEVREDLRRQLLINKYVEQEAQAQLTVSDQEVQTLYQQFTAQAQANATSGQAIPTMSELRPQLENLALQQKRQQITNQLLTEASQNAEIEVLLDGVAYPPESLNQTATTTGGGNTNTNPPVQPGETTPTPTTQGAQQ